MGDTPGAVAVPAAVVGMIVAADVVADMEVFAVAVMLVVAA